MMRKVEKKECKQKFRSIIVICTLLLLVITSACGNNTATGTDDGSSTEQATYQFKLAHIAPEGHLWHEAALTFAKELESRSEGRMKVDIYPGGQLGNEADSLQQITAGSLDFGFVTAAYLTSRSESFSAWFAPFMFDSYEAANIARKSQVAQNILGTLDEQGLKGLDYFFSGSRNMFFREKVDEIEDLQGLTLRVTPSPALQDWYRLLGASPESISLPDVYQALQTGVIDGMEMDLDVTILANFHEVTNYGLLTNHMVWPAVVVMNLNKFDDLPQEDRKIVEEAIKATTEYATLKRASQEEEFVQQLRDKGMELDKMDKSLFDPYIKQYDEQYMSKHPLIEQFIKEFRK